MKEKEKLSAAVQSLIHLKNIAPLLTEQLISPLAKSFYPINKVPLLLIRPDGQIAWRPKTLDLDIKSIFSQLIPAV